MLRAKGHDTGNVTIIDTGAESMLVGGDLIPVIGSGTTLVVIISTINDTIIAITTEYTIASSMEPSHLVTMDTMH